MSGESVAIDQLAPTLRRDGWAITQHAVLIYGGKVGSTGESSKVPDIGWLKQIARIRRRRPVDALVAVIRSSDNNGVAFETDFLIHQLHLQSRALGWSAPSYVLNASELLGGQPNAAEVIGCTWSARNGDLQPLDTALSALSNRLAERGVSQLAQHLQQPYLAQLSILVNAQRAGLIDLIGRLGKSRACGTAVHGVLFAPLFAPTGGIRESEGKVASAHLPATVAAPSSPWQDANWQAIAHHSRVVRGRRVGLSVSTVVAWSCTLLLGLWLGGSLVSAAANRAGIADAGAVITRLQGVQKPVAAALDLDALQKQIDTLEVRQRDGAPWYSRFGLNQNAPLLAALWPHYQAASQRILTAPLQRQLEANLQQRNGMSDQELVNGGDAQVKAAYADLKMYLTLAQPHHTEPAFLIPQWLASGQPAMPSQSQINAGGWRDLSQRLISFHVNHLATHAGCAIAPDAGLIGAARQSLIAVIGLQNSTDVLYQSILDDNASKYPPISLQTLLGNHSSRGLFGTNASVPGVLPVRRGMNG